MRKAKPEIAPVAVGDFIKELPLFNRLSADEIAILVGYLEVLNIEKGNVLLQEGDKGDFLCFVIQGSLDVVKRMKNNETIEIATLPKGSTIGEMAIIDHWPRSATVKARSDCKLASLSSKDLESILLDHPPIGIKILKGLLANLSLKMRRTTRRLAESTEDYKDLLFEFRGQF